MSRLLTLSFVLLCLFIVPTIGCDDLNAGRSNVSGTITLDGEPISGGTIIFQPVNPDPSGVNSGMQVQILNGRYSLIGAQGLLPGDYRVKLQCQRVIDKNTKQDYTGNTDDASAFTVIDVIPEQFNTKSEIIFTVEEKKGAKTFDYDVKTK